MKIEIVPHVVLPDEAPLLHLAAAGRLSLLQAFGRVLVMDIVATEASADLSTPWAREVGEWLSREQAGASLISVVKTEIGEAYRLARLADPRFKLQGAGDRAIRDWLIDLLPDIGGPALVVYEDKRLPKLIRRERLEETVVMATTRALLVFAEERGLINSAEETWRNIKQKAVGASPSLESTLIPPRRAS